MTNLQKFYVICLIVCNLFVCFNAQYVKVPASDKDVKGTLRHSLELKCEYRGTDNNGEFLEWYKDNITISSEKAGHYGVYHSHKESKLVIKIFVPKDGEVKRWYVKSSKAGFEDRPLCEFRRIDVKPSPQRIETERNERLDTSHSSVRRYNGQTVEFKCIVEPEIKKKTVMDKSKHKTEIKWEFSIDDETYTTLPLGVSLKDESLLIISSIDKSHRGYYRCAVTDFKFTVLLRVRDRIAPLWPFLGIIGIVAILVIIILIFEKRQRVPKKTPTAEDEERDRTKDPLVRTPKSPDDESKKRIVKT